MARTRGLERVRTRMEKDGATWDRALATEEEPRAPELRSSRPEGPIATKLGGFFAEPATRARNAAAAAGWTTSGMLPSDAAGEPAGSPSERGAPRGAAGVAKPSEATGPAGGTIAPPLGRGRSIEKLLAIADEGGMAGGAKSSGSTIGEPTKAVRASKARRAAEGSEKGESSLSRARFDRVARPASSPRGAGVGAAQHLAAASSARRIGEAIARSTSGKIRYER